MKVNGITKRTKTLVSMILLSFLSMATAFATEDNNLAIQDDARIFTTEQSAQLTEYSKVLEDETATQLKVYTRFTLDEAEVNEQLNRLGQELEKTSGEYEGSVAILVFVGEKVSATEQVKVLANGKPKAFLPDEKLNTLTKTLTSSKDEKLDSATIRLYQEIFNEVAAANGWEGRMEEPVDKEGGFPTSIVIMLIGFFLLHQFINRDQQKVKKKVKFGE